MRVLKAFTPVLFGLLAVVVAVGALGSAIVEAAPAGRPLANHDLTATLYAVDVAGEFCTSVGFPFSPKAWLSHDMSEALGMENGVMGYFEKITDTYGTLCADPGLIAVILDFGASYSVTDVSFWSSGDMSDVAAGSLWCNSGDCADPNSDDWHSFPGGDSSDWYTPTESVERIDMETNYGAGVQFRYIQLRIEGVTGDPDLVRANIDAVRITFINAETCPPYMTDPGFQEDYSSPTFDDAWLSPQDGGLLATLDISGGHLYLPARDTGSPILATQIIHRTGPFTDGYKVEVAVQPTNEVPKYLWVGFSDDINALAAYNTSSDPADLDFTHVATITIQPVGIAETTNYTALVTAPFTDYVLFFLASADPESQADDEFLIEFVCIEDSTAITGTPDDDDPCIGGDLTNGDFGTSGGWTLAGGATIAGGYLNLPTGASAVQTVVMSGTNQGSYDLSAVIPSSGSLVVSIGSWEWPASLPAGTIELSNWFSVTPALTGEVSIELLNTGGSFKIDYFCLQVEGGVITGGGGDGGGTGPGSSGECLGVVNGTFDTSTNGWYLSNGAIYNSTGDNVLLPANSPFAEMAQPNIGPLPAITGGLYLLLEFDGRANIGQTVVQFATGEATDTIEYSRTANALYQTYEIDISALAGGMIDIRLSNAGVITPVPSLFIDNVCIYTSTTPASPPHPPDGPGGPGGNDDDDPVPIPAPTPGGSQGVTCANISLYFSQTIGINLIALEEMDTPGFLDFSDWVPWLAGRLWVNLGKPLTCLIITFFNHVFNFMAWIIRQPFLFVAWFFAWVNTNFPTVGAWLMAFWDWFIFGLSIIGDVAIWLWGVVLEVSDWLFGVIQTLLADLLTVLILAWNAFITWGGWLISELLAWISPIFWLLANFGTVWEAISTLLTAIFEFMVALFNAAYGLVMMAWTLGQEISMAPFTLWLSFMASINDPAYDFSFYCSTLSDPGCYIYGGLALANYAGGPLAWVIVVVFIIFATITIFWRKIWPQITNHA